MPDQTLSYRGGSVARLLTAGALAVALCLLAVPLARSSGSHLAVTLGGGPATVDQVVGSAAGVVAGATLAWAALGVLLTAGAALPGVLGDALSHAAGLVTPALFSRVVAAGLGLTVVGGASPALAGSVAPGPSAAAAAFTASAGRSDAASPSIARWAPAPGAPEPLPDQPSTLDRPASVAPEAAVTVQPGDCLWVIASRDLGAGATAAQVAASWPQWYAANRDVIGADPDLIHPGQRLVPPH